MHPKIDLHSHFITKCRAFCEIFYSFIGFLLFFFSLAANAATPEQLSMIKEAAENHVLSTVDMPAGGELVVNAANIDDRLFATDCPEPLTTNSSSSNGSAANITVLVECKPDNWRVYVGSSDDHYPTHHCGNPIKSGTNDFRTRCYVKYGRPAAFPAARFFHS